MSTGRHHPPTDHLQGRVISVVMVVATSMAAAAPVAGGALLTYWPARAVALVFATAVAGAALAATFLRVLRPVPVPRVK